MQLPSQIVDDLTRIATELHETFLEEPVLEPRGRPLPDRGEVTRLVDDLRALLFPGYFGTFKGEGDDLACLVERLGTLYWRLTALIHDTVSHDCPQPCAQGCHDFRYSAALAADFLSRLPRVRRVLALDVQAAVDGDPAARDVDEVVLSYPGLYAVMVYRLAHELHELGVRLIPRIMTEHAHSQTGIDIHPGARIGHRFFIDHGTGVVVGETCEIGHNVKIYQGVTLGALSVPRDAQGKVIRSGTGKRHPTIEDDVVIYAGATILGGQTVIGRGSVIGGNVWLIESVPPGSKVINRPTIEMR